MSVFLGLLHKSASHKIPSLRYVILGHAKKCQRNFTISQTRNQFRGGFLNPLLLWGGLVGMGAEGGPREVQEAQGGERGGARPQGGKRGGPQGGRAKGGTGAGRAQGPLCPLLLPFV